MPNVYRGDAGEALLHRCGENYASVRNVSTIVAHATFERATFSATIRRRAEGSVNAYSITDTITVLFADIECAMTNQR